MERQSDSVESFKEFLERGKTAKKTKSYQEALSNFNIARTMSRPWNPYFQKRRKARNTKKRNERLRSLPSCDQRVLKPQPRQRSSRPFPFSCSGSMPREKPRSSITSSKKNTWNTRQRWA